MNQNSKHFVRQVHLPINDCIKCKLSNTRSIIAKDYIPNNPKLVIIKLLPSLEADLNKEELPDWYSDLLENLSYNNEVTVVNEDGSIDFIELNSENIAIINLLKCYTGKEYNDYSIPMVKCYSNIEIQFKTIKPKVILTLGQKAFEYLTGTSQKTKYIPNTQYNFSRLIGRTISIACTDLEGNKWEGHIIIGINTTDSRFDYYRSKIYKNLYRKLAQYYGDNSE